MIVILNSDALTETKQELINNQKEIKLLMKNNVAEVDKKDEFSDNVKEVRYIFLVKYSIIMNN